MNLNIWVVWSDGYCEQNVRSRTAIGNEAFMDKRKLLSKSLNVDLRKIMTKCFVWSVALYMYVAETWTWIKAERKWI